MQIIHECKDSHNSQWANRYSCSSQKVSVNLSEKNMNTDFLNDELNLSTKLLIHFDTI